MARLSGPAGGLAAVLSVSLLTPSAHAYHSSSTPQITDYTAHTVPKGMHKAGLFTIEYGVTDSLQVETFLPTWGLLFPSAGFEWRFLDSDILDASVGLDLMYLHTRSLRAVFPELPTADAFVAPLSIDTTFHVHPAFEVHAGPEYTLVGVDGYLNDDDFEGAAAASSLQLHGMLTWIIDPHVALLLRGRYGVVQLASAAAKVRVEIDDYTTLEAEGVGRTNALDFPNAFQLVVGSHMSFAAFNLILGVGYGNNFVPVANFYLPRRGLAPLADVYWRF